MGIYLNPNEDGFRESVDSQIYVDKTGLLTYTNSVLATRQKFICISRPRRFGKTMAAEMLTAYYCRACESKELFQDLKISKDPSFEKYLNKYDVIFVNMQQILSSAGSAELMIAYLQKEVLCELRGVYPEFISEKETDLPSALASIYDKTRQGFVIIIDEWDCIFRENQQEHVSQTAYLDFLRNWLKDRTYVKLAYMTGILPIKKYGTHSALNMFSEFSMIDAGIVAEYVGFTEEEVVTLCRHYDMDLQEVLRWYDGYQLASGLHIFNPKSVVECMLRKRFGSYWTSTETYEALKVYIDLNYDGLKDAVVQMLGGNRCEIDPETFHNDMTTFANKDDVLTLLVHLGYLAFEFNSREVYIPNEEVRGEFLRAIKSSGWSEVIQAVEISKQLLEDTLQGREEAVAKGIDLVHTDTTSILQYNNENALSCVISLAYYSAREEYLLIREFPTGKGFADLVFLPRRHSNKPAMIVEMKWDVSAEGAISQIKRKQYCNALQDYAGEVVLVGINYDKASKVHQCVIERVYK